MSKGYISPKGRSKRGKSDPKRYACLTIPANTSPGGVRTATSKRIAIKGVESKAYSLDSRDFTGRDVSILLGNELARERILPLPSKKRKIQPLTKPDTRSNYDWVPMAVVTNAQRRNNDGRSIDLSRKVLQLNAKRRDSNQNDERKGKINGEPNSTRPCQGAVS